MQKLRDRYPGVLFMNHLSNASLKSQFKKADKLNANYAIIYGEEEELNNMVTLKNLRTKEPQQMLTQQNLFNLLDILTRGK